MPNNPSNLNEHNQALRQVSKTLFGESMCLEVVDPRELVLLRKNARVLKKSVFKQLTENIKQDGRLSSVPLCHRIEAGKLEVLSGNHRVQAAIQAGLEHILVLVILGNLSRSRQLAIQLSHNSLAGEDDPIILAELWASIEEINAKLYAGLSSDLVEKLEKIELVNFSTPQVYAQTMSFAFVDAEASRLNKVIENLESLPDKAFYLSRLQDFERFFDLLEQVKKKFTVRNTSLAMLRMLEIVENHLAASIDSDKGAAP